MRCKGGNADEDSCTNIDGCEWYAARNACGPKCENLGAGPCKDPAFGCAWTSEGKCAVKGSPGTEGFEAGNKCSAYTSGSDCNAGTGCAWDVGSQVCYEACSSKSTQPSCGGLRDKDGTQRCLWANNKCSPRVVAQCRPLWADDSQTIGVVAGVGGTKMSAGQWVLIAIVAVAVIIIVVLSVLEYRAVAGGMGGGGGGGGVGLAAAGVAGIGGDDGL